MRHLNHHRKKEKSTPAYTFLSIVLLLFCHLGLSAQIVLLGDNAPYPNVNDGDFNLIQSGSWRLGLQSPFWTPSMEPQKEGHSMGLFAGRYFSSFDYAYIDSKPLNTTPGYQDLKVGDELNWSLGADLEYISKGSLSLLLFFGEQERILAEKVKLIGSDKTVEHFSGTYTITQKDVMAGPPRVRVVFYSSEDVKVFLDYVNLSVKAPEKEGPSLSGKIVADGIRLDWTDKKAHSDSKFSVYRSRGKSEAYNKLTTTADLSFTDTDLINGMSYSYVVTRLDTSESAGSNKVLLKKIDSDAPAPPTALKIKALDTEIKLEWNKSIDVDVAYYSVYRGDSEGNQLRQIAHDLTSTQYVDFTPKKEDYNSYVVFAHDHSGNKSKASQLLRAKVKAVSGTSFSDLILPIPIHKDLRSDLWGAEGVLPRDPDNGIEDPEWSYWGGRPVKDQDNKYHMLVTRWPANATKGHWEWPNSTVAHVISETPTGPYKVKEDTAYGFHNGLGHNPDIILLNDGTYMLYSLIDWEATLFTSKTMNGPWKRLGTMTVDWKSSNEDEKLSYRYYRNLSGVQLKDGRFLFVTKAGEMMRSVTDDPLGPYTVLTDQIRYNPIIPEKYRNSNYEDPVLWKDEVQYHMIINAFWDYRAIYLRSPDGIHWKFNPGTAYTPDNTSYEDGTRTHWYKLERPHILQDEYGRAPHLSLAVIDVPKADDLARDKHSSKNIIVPLTVHKRIQLLNKQKIGPSTKKIRVLIHSEADFDAQNDIDLTSLRFGASEEVDFGKGSKVIKTKKKGKDLIVEFDGSGNGITDMNFAGKLLGKTKEGKLIIAFSKLAANKG
ncbi:hypothetical protein SAMN05421766_102349 [Zobellia uliginosa]|uniref:Fibronectin type III domain-containing protein n=1 Tax=Zobellia uliginosa TaxID=143224 RepID=A0ABY1KRY9_9FLAO|nr:hypothetical protein [Zobellia uliginosa]SIS49049.1 hypothetical protein SAMN05421766_102349 [Zobellia uliginosa]